MTYSILVIGSEPASRNSLVAAFDEAGFITATAPDYHGMLFNKNGFKPDLVIMDEVLLDEDAVEVCSQIRNIFDAPIIVLGKDSTSKQLARAVEAGADSYLRVPFSDRLLIARVNALLRRYKAPIR